MNQTNLIKSFVEKNETGGTSSNMFIDGNILYSYGHHFPLLVRRQDGFLMNADHYSVTTSHHQARCAKHADFLIPFSILSRLHLDYMTVKIIDQSKERWDLTGYKKEEWNDGQNGYHIEHISVSKYESLSNEKKIGWEEVEERRPVSLVMANPDNDKCYLASMDNNNYFASELPCPVDTVELAFHILRPVEVRGLIEGTDYLRQGEWFFIPCGGAKPLKSSIQKGMEKDWFERKVYNYNGIEPAIVTQKYNKIVPIEFLHNRNQDLEPHHYATEYGFNLGCPHMVRGTVHHTNHDHKMLKLGNGRQWYMAIESNHVLSVGVGMVD
jgi:hypothetical protein